MATRLTVLAQRRRVSLAAEITRVLCDDWEGVYLNGRLIAQHHHVDLRDVVEALGAEYHFLEVDAQWAQDEGELPIDLGMIPEEVRIT